MKEKAEASLRRTLNLDPANANHEALRALAATALAQDAAPRFRVLFALESDWESAWFNLGPRSPGHAPAPAVTLSVLASGHRLVQRFSGDIWNPGTTRRGSIVWRWASTPEQSGLHVRRGAVYLTRRKAEEGEKGFQRKLRLDPSGGRAMLARHRF
jgi:hypothetical protein